MGTLTQGGATGSRLRLLLVGRFALGYFPKAFQAILIKVPHDQFRSQVWMKMALVATIDSIPESIVGFSKGLKGPRLLPRAQ